MGGVIEEAGSAAVPHRTHRDRRCTDIELPERHREV